MRNDTASPQRTRRTPKQIQDPAHTWTHERTQGKAVDLAERSKSDPSEFAERHVGHVPYVFQRIWVGSLVYSHGRHHAPKKDAARNIARSGTLGLGASAWGDFLPLVFRRSGRPYAASTSIPTSRP